MAKNAFRNPLTEFTFTFPLAINVDVTAVSDVAFTRKNLLKQVSEKYQNDPSELRFRTEQIKRLVPVAGVISLTKNEKTISGIITLEGSGITMDTVENMLSEVFRYAPYQGTISRRDKDSFEVGLEYWVVNTMEQIKVNVPDSYWKAILKNQRSDDYVVARLVSILKGFYVEDCFFEKEAPTREGALEFTDSKRPYGNKDVAASIAFNLGWDWAGVLHSVGVPDFVEKEAMRLHKLVIKELKQELKNDLRRN